ncbi:MAG: hypothetical protein LBT47_02015 [Deltaproteobacteria bacterium]|jgi:hypothetical protein|nr:hypothetical protein [Deltaproteobacteria bacterium]
MVKNLFSHRAWLIVIIGSILLLTLSFFLKGKKWQDIRYGQNPRPDSFSTSVVGFAGLFQILEQSPSGAGRRGGFPQSGVLRLLIVTEAVPLNGYQGPVLIVLPKWNYQLHPHRAGWAANISLAPLSNINYFVQDLTIDLPTPLRSPWPDSIQKNFSGPLPAGEGLIQLLPPDSLSADIWCEQGILLGRLKRPGPPVYILSDPDVLNNLGLTRGQNPELALAMFDYLRAQVSATGHSLFLQTSLADSEDAPPVIGDFFGAMLQFPMIIVTGLLIASIFLTIAASSERFGGLPPPQEGPEFGKVKLIENSSRLLSTTGNYSNIFIGYLDLVMRQTAQLYCAPKGLDKPRLIDWLSQLSQNRNLSIEPKNLYLRAAKLRPNQGEAQLLSIARDIQRWKEELERGPSNNSRHRQ